ncbi:hypothetical protein H4W32_007083 [Actinophytocola algeriensis]|uniref:Nucleotide pyrophosphohydrolase n=1 Tax=Actinophytocola algeriensis TaxID=1768010 RepID=A0A7W7QCH7_9PSEU|nr:hypothetical protein [Actinophytocola algeriensis]MBE1479041.1 hypothetical protein [Actinophytocola algeriensis]
MVLNDLQRELRAFAAERDWQRFHTPKNLVMALAGEAGGWWSFSSGSLPMSRLPS